MTNGGDGGGGGGQGGQNTWGPNWLGARNLGKTFAVMGATVKIWGP